MEYAIGIRPVIDGRQGGIREGLEEQTMQMALTAKKLIEDNVRRSDGKPVNVVIADTTIGGGKESAMCEDKFSALGVVATLTVTPCWCYGTETMDLNPHTLKAVWGFNGTERPGAVYLAAVMAAYAQRGLPAFAIYGRDVQDMDDTTVPDDVRDKILRFARCAAAIGELKNKSYLNIGGVSMGIAGSNADAMMLQRYFGLRTEWIDMTEVLRRIKLDIYDKEQYDIARAWVKANCPIGLDINTEPHSAEQYEQDWDFIVKMTLICRDLMQGNPKLLEMGYKEESNGRNAIAAGFQGQRQWTDWLPNGDFTEAILNSTFDWNGKKAPSVFATENDCLNGMAMLVGNLLTHRAVGFADVRTYWSPEAVKRVTGKAPTGKAKDGFIHLINSGAAALDATGACKNKDGKGEMKQWWDMTDKDISACLAATDWCPANLGYFRGGGFSSHFKTDAEMPVTMIRINIVNGLGPVIQLAEGYTVTLPDDMHRILDERTDRTWPTTWFAPNVTGKGAFKDVYSVMANWGANHGAFVYGHIGKDVLTLASMLRIPVNMHNLPDSDVFRPHCWTAFGTDDIEGSDYRACANYGPLFK
ncbi:MAG: L-fucose isomerase [Clostridia bacterium]|nr:L-fucose isomerase [Clostridia bacterium]